MSLKKLPSIRLEAPADQRVRVKVPQRAFDLYQAEFKKKESAPVDNEISIYGVIGETWFGDGVTLKKIDERLKKLDGADATVLINSPGGDAFEGIAIYNRLREYSGKVNVNIIGEAASAASVIAMAGDHIRLAEAGIIMIHSARGAIYGSEADMTAIAEVLRMLDDNVAGLYSARSGLDKQKLLDMMRAETYMSADMAMENGFVDEVVKAGKTTKTTKTKATASRSMPSLPASGQPGMAMMQRGQSSEPGVTGKRPVTLKGDKVMKKSLAEMIASFESKRAALNARAEEIIDTSNNEGRTLDEAESEEYDTITAEIKQIDDHLVRLHERERNQVDRSTVIDPEGVNNRLSPPARANPQQSGQPFITVRPNVEAGIGFTRYVKAMAIARGNPHHAMMIAKNNQQWKDQTPDVERILMAAVAGGVTTTNGWASEWVYDTNLVADFINILRPATIIGRISNLRNVPFNVRMGGATSGSTGYWVGQGAPVPASKMTSTELTLGIAKAAGLVVLAEELIRSSAPSAEMLVRDDLRDSIAQFLDQQFVDPNYAASANISPGSITNDVVAKVPSGTTAAHLRADVESLFGEWITNNLRASGGVWIMPETLALTISLMRTSLDQPEFPGINMTGGTFFGLPVITSESANVAASPDSGKMLILANAPEILMADEGGLEIDASREAAIQMLDNPTNNAASGTATSMVSMFQTNSVAIKAVRFINWKKRRSFAVQYIQSCAYTSGS